MMNPNVSGDLVGLRKLLDRLAAVDRAACRGRRPPFMPELITGEWLKGDAYARRKIEEEIDRLPKRLTH